MITENWFAPGLQIDRHVHQHTHFTFVLEGGFVESYDRMVLECEAGSTLFVPAGAPHTDRISPEGAHTIGIELSPGVAERVIGQTGILADARVLSDPGIERAGHRLYREFRSGDAAAPLSMESIAIEMLVQASRARSVGERGEPDWMQSVRDLLHETYMEPVSLGNIAAQVRIHETHLARAFRKRHGCTVGEYVRRLRVDAAAIKLKNADTPISQIAADTGFYDQAHFCRTFKRAYGLSPSEYRSR